MPTHPLIFLQLCMSVKKITEKLFEIGSDQQFCVIDQIDVLDGSGGRHFSSKLCDIETIPRYHEGIHEPHDLLDGGRVNDVDLIEKPGLAVVVGAHVVILQLEQPALEFLELFKTFLLEIYVGLHGEDRIGC